MEWEAERRYPLARNAVVSRAARCISFLARGAYHHRAVKVVLAVTSRKPENPGPDCITAIYGHDVSGAERADNLAHP
jgi:hypothetical protein